MSLYNRMQEIWYGGGPLAMAMLPLAMVFSGCVRIRRWLYRVGVLRTVALPVPVIVVGNLAVGGSGKTPLVIWLYNFLKSREFHPGIVSRGYGGRARHWPQQVRTDSDPVTVGDEALLMARRTEAPIAVGPDRVAAAKALIEHHGCDVIISDDGLQHYALRRNLEIAVVDGVRRYGNGFCLPAGPLREPLSRLKNVDLVVSRGLGGRGEFPMKYIPQPLQPLRRSLGRGRSVPTPQQEVHAVAAIGNPDGFFDQLRTLGFRMRRHAFPDHHAFRAEDIQFGDGIPVIMTEKDAVKCERFAGPEHWYMPVRADLPTVFEHRLVELLKRKGHGQKTA
jgi:tetraacyldisaccharide 4'-kinase